MDALGKIEQRLPKSRRARQPLLALHLNDLSISENKLEIIARAVRFAKHSGWGVVDVGNPLQTLPTSEGYQGDSCYSRLKAYTASPCGSSGVTGLRLIG